MGRKNTPTRLKALRGNPGKRPLNKNEPKPISKIQELPPDFLIEPAKEEWSRIYAEMKELGILTNLDSSVLAAYCTAYALWRQANEYIKEEGILVNAPSGYPMQAPYVAVLNKQVDIMVKLASEFGMTPASRTKIKTEKTQEDDPMEQILRNVG